MPAVQWTADLLTGFCRFTAPHPGGGLNDVHDERDDDDHCPGDDAIPQPSAKKYIIISEDRNAIDEHESLVICGNDWVSLRLRTIGLYYGIQQGICL